MAGPQYLIERRHVRYLIDSRAKLINGQGVVVARTIDISEGGMAILSPTELGEDGHFSVEFVFPSIPESFRAQLSLRNRSGFRYGFQFKELDEKNLAMLRKYLRRSGYVAAK
jgi:c-di-GMP-binding flagellar brake protein YcgR